MKWKYPPYDFLIVIGGTIILGIILRLLFFKKPIKLTSKVAPYALAYVLIALIFAVIIMDFPIKFYGIPEEVSSGTSSHPNDNPQLMQVDPKYVGQRIATFILNPIFWITALVIGLKGTNDL
jgi:hypothetical protein